jgi:heme/copper-type cytochrome/quinol oxidase subunit 3
MLSILMFFMVLTAAFVVLRIKNLHTWSAIRLPWILWLNTAVLLASSATLELARRKLQVDRLRGFRQMWALTTILGMIFLAGQVIAWKANWLPKAFTWFHAYRVVSFIAHCASRSVPCWGICALAVGRRALRPRVSRLVAAEVTW